MPLGNCASYAATPGNMVGSRVQIYTFLQGLVQGQYKRALVLTRHLPACLCPAGA